MIYSQACGYCLTALCRLRLISAAGPVRVAELCRVKGAEKDDLPVMFVAKIFQDLVRNGILASSRGRNGGFSFARPPAKIRMIDIVDAVDGVGSCRACISGLAACNEQQPCPLHDRFAPIRQEVLRFLHETSLEDLSESLVGKMRHLGLPLDGLSVPECAGCDSKAGGKSPVSAGIKRVKMTASAAPAGGKPSKTAKGA